MNLQENSEKFLLRRSKQIIHSLRLLAKAKSMITGRFQTGKYSFLTVIIEVLPEKKLLILDYGHNEAINTKLLDASHVVFITRYKGIKVRFSSERVHKNTFRGQPVFVTAIPDSIYWRERRECYRVKLPIVNPVYCRIRLGGESPGAPPKTRDLRVVNIGPDGLALLLPNDEKSLGEIGTRFEKCILALPEHREEISLEIRHQTPVDPADERSDSWIGCIFLETAHAIQSRILRYMQSVERQQKEFER